MKRIIGRSLLVLGSVVVLIAGGLQAETVPYKVDDYIPVLFKDAMLYVAGSFDFNGNSNEQSNDSAGGSSYIYQKSDYQRDNINFGGDLYYQRRYKTVQNWYLYNGQFNADLLKQKTSDGYEYVYTPTYSNKERYDNDATHLNPSMYHSFDVGTYLSGDLMLSSRGSFEWDYDKTSSNDQTHFEQAVEIVGTNATRYTSTTETELPGDSKRTVLIGEILFGQGRMYDGVFAFTAISMIEELERKGLLERMPTKDEMEELTEVIYQNRMLHYIDYRIRKIEIMEELVGYLSSKGIVEVSNPMTTPVVRDVWDYFPTSTREFGLMVRGGFGIRHNYSSSQSSQKSENHSSQETYDINDPGNVTTVIEDHYKTHQSIYSRRTASFPYVTLIVQKNQPISPRVQLNLMAQGWLYFSTNDSTYNENRGYDGDSLLYSSNYNNNSEYESITSFALSGQLYYLFDNRTTASLTASYQRYDYDQTLTEAYYYNDVYQFGDTIVNDVGGYSLNLGASLEYRITIPTTISASVNYYKNTASLFASSAFKYENDSYYFRAGISHYLF